MNVSESKGVIKQILGLETAPHLKASMTTQKIMLIVFLCLVPAFAVDIFYFGFGVLWQFLNCAITALLCELLVAFLRKRPVIHYLSDLSYLVTAMILALTLPPLLPVYYGVVTTVFAIIFVKSVFGGLGHNIFNPAMAGFIFIVISCPKIVGTTWIAPAPQAYTYASAQATFDVVYSGKNASEIKNLVDSLNVTDNSNDAIEAVSGHSLTKTLDAFTGATFLEQAKTPRKSGVLNEMTPNDYSKSQNQAYIALAIAYILGGIVLLAFRIIIFKMVFTFFAAFIVFSAIFYHLNPGQFFTPLDNLLFGGTMLAGFFIITDPVTNSGTARGRVYFSILVAFLIVIIRAYGSYSDAVAFSIMLANACAPLIDVLTRRRSYGIRYKKKGGLL